MGRGRPAAGPSATVPVRVSVAHNNTGGRRRIQGALMSLVSLAGILGPVLFATSFGYFISDTAIVHLPGVPWLIAAFLLGLAVLIAWRFARPPTAAAAVDAVGDAA